MGLGALSLWALDVVWQFVGLVAGAVVWACKFWPHDSNRKATVVLANTRTSFIFIAEAPLVGKLKHFQNRVGKPDVAPV